MTWARILGASSLSLLACTSHLEEERPLQWQPDSEAQQLGWAEAQVGWAGPKCPPLPAELPPAAVIEYDHDDTEHRQIFDVAYVADADCPPRENLFPAPKCIRMMREAMQIMWTTLREHEIHRIETVELDGDCIHCGRRWITVKWPGAVCSMGYSSVTDISDDTQDRFYAAAHYLDHVSERVLGRPE